jgi:aminoglycoside phosphotransferase (APT) family kinase protein
MNVAPVITGSTGADGVRRFLEGEPVAAAWARLERLLEPGAAVRDCRIQRVKLKPGRKLSAWCVAILRDPRGKLHTRHVAITWSLVESPLAPGTDVLEEEARRRGLAAPFRSLVTEVPRWRMRILAAPLDPRFPALVRMCDGAFAGEALGRGGAPATVGTIRYRPGERHVLRYTGPAEASYAKLYRPGAAAQAYRRALSVCAAVSLGAAGVRASRPLLCRSEDALVTSAVHGRPAGPGDADLEAVGSLLRLIHRGVPPSGPAATLAGEIEAVERAAGHVDALLPAAATALRRTLAAARERDERTGAQSAVLVHGDFKLDHLFWDGASVTVIDLDRAGPGEPALDLGKMLADLRWRRTGGGPAGGADACDRLLRGYRRIGAHCLARARLYEVVFLLKAAARRAPLLDPSWERVVEAAVRDAEALVDAGRGPAPARRAGGVPA